MQQWLVTFLVEWKLTIELNQNQKRKRKVNRRDALKAVACATTGLVTINEANGKSNDLDFDTVATDGLNSSIVCAIDEMISTVTQELTDQIKSIIPISTIDVNSITKFMPNTIIVDLG